MTGYTFDTLSASKQLREAGMAEGVAEAVVAVFQHATTGLDLGHLATKADLAELKVDLAELRAETKTEITAVRAEMATKVDLELLAHTTKADLFSLEARVVKEVHSTVRSYTFGAVAMLGSAIGIAAIAIKWLP